MTVQKFQSELLKVIQVSPNTKHFVFETSPDFSFLSGQFVMVTLSDEAGQAVRRAFSIASPPSQKGSIDLCIKILPEGRLSSHLGKLAPKQSVQMEGPYGKFTLEPSHPSEVVFIAAGTGIAPIRSMLIDLLERGHKGQITLIFGFHGSNDYIYQQEIESLAKKHKNVQVVPICSTPESSWNCKVGHVQDVIVERYPDGSDIDVYLCGPPKMVSETVAVLTKQKFVRIHREAW